MALRRSVMEVRLEGRNMRPPHGGDLRKGRHSEGARVYLVTTVVRARAPVFAQWQVGRELVRALRTIDQEA